MRSIGIFLENFSGSAANEVSSVVCSVSDQDLLGAEHSLATSSVNVVVIQGSILLEGLKQLDGGDGTLQDFLK